MMVNSSVHMAAAPLRLLCASAGAKDPQASDTLCIEALAAPNTIKSIPEKTMLAFTMHGAINELMREDGCGAEVTLVLFAEADVDVGKGDIRLQKEGAASFK